MIYRTYSDMNYMEKLIKVYENMASQLFLCIKLIRQLRFDVGDEVKEGG